MPRQTKKQLMDEIREYNDEAFYPDLMLMSMAQLRDYLAELEKQHEKHDNNLPDGDSSITTNRNY